MKLIASAATVGWACIVALAWWLANARIEVCQRSSGYVCMLRATAARDNVLIGGLIVALIAFVTVAISWHRHGGRMRWRWGPAVQSAARKIGGRALISSATAYMALIGAIIASVAWDERGTDNANQPIATELAVDVSFGSETTLTPVRGDPFHSAPEADEDNLSREAEPQIVAYAPDPNDDGGDQGVAGTDREAVEASE